jgi:HSP90 family molecular chaperone
VTVYTRSYKPEETGWIWSSDGVNSYAIEPGLDLLRGTKVLIDLKEEDRELSRSHRVEAIIKRYPNFVGFPIEINGSAVNTIRAIWTRGKSELAATDYEEFCKHTHDVVAAISLSF